MATLGAAFGLAAGAGLAFLTGAGRAGGGIMATLGAACGLAAGTGSTFLTGAGDGAITGAGTAEMVAGGFFGALAGGGARAALFGMTGRAATLASRLLVAIMPRAGGR